MYLQRGSGYQIPAGVPSAPVDIIECSSVRAHVVELVYTVDSKPAAARIESSNLSMSTAVHKHGTVGPVLNKVWSLNCFVTDSPMAHYSNGRERELKPPTVSVRI